MSQDLLQRVQFVRAQHPKIWELCASIVKCSDGHYSVGPDDQTDLVSDSVVMKGDLLLTEDGREVRASHNGVVVAVKQHARRLVLWVIDDAHTDHAAFESSPWKEGGRISIINGDRIDPKFLSTLLREKNDSRDAVSLRYVVGDRVGERANGETLSFPRSGKLQLQFVGEPGKITLRSWKARTSESGSADLTRQTHDVAAQVLEACATSARHSTRKTLNEFFGALFFLSDPKTLIALPQKLYDTEALMRLLRIPTNRESPFFVEKRLVEEFSAAYEIFQRLANSAWAKGNQKESATCIMDESLPDKVRQEVLTVLAVPQLRGICEVALRVLLGYQPPGRVVVYRLTNQGGYQAFTASAA